MSKHTDASTYPHALVTVAKITHFRLPFSMYRQMPLNIPFNCIKMISWSTDIKYSSLEINCKITRMKVDSSSSNLISWQAVKKSKLPFVKSCDRDF